MAAIGLMDNDEIFAGVDSRCLCAVRGLVSNSKWFFHRKIAAPGKEMRVLWRAFYLARTEFGVHKLVEQPV
jgi:hypothetical protein